MNAFSNVYEDNERADSYAKLEFPNTYYLAYRDIPELLRKYKNSGRVLDFGCGTGRSSRFIRKLGFDVVGVDISKDMVQKARKLDPSGDYRCIKNGDFEEFEVGSFDIVLSIFTFDNIPGIENRLNLLNGLSDLLNEGGILVLLDSTPEIYYHEWASFSTKDFSENRNAKSGGRVKIIMTDVNDSRPVDDIMWFEEDYLNLFTRVGLKVLEIHKPLGRKDESIAWVNETVIPPWVIYVLK